jgi:adenosylhomocysteine nucleosidase
MIILVALEDELNKEDFDKIQIEHMGVGKINAAIKTTEAIRKYSPELIINYGTAGSLKKNISGLVEVTNFFQRDMDASPLGIKVGETPFEDSFEIHFGRDGLSCGTGDSFVTDKPELLTDLVDMEAYAIAKICKMNDIDFRCFKYISDQADDSAGQDWKENVAQGKKFFIKKMREIYG